MSQETLVAHSPTTVAARLDRTEADRGSLFYPTGAWTVANVGELEPAVEEAVAAAGRAAVLDLSRLDHLDTAGAWLIRRLSLELEEAGAAVELVGLSDNAKRLLHALEAPGTPEATQPARRPRFGMRFVEGVGRAVHEFWLDTLAGLSILGGVIRGVGRTASEPRAFRFTSLIHHLDRTGLQAVPIIFLMSFLIGGIIAQQGAFQLQAFGADLFVVDLVGVLVLREIGVLLTAIMIAGRSGSAYTAEIGSMKMREEIDALQVIGLDPAEVLVLPRILALIIALPLLTFVADLAALLGGALVSFLYVDLTFEAFLSRLRDAVSLNTLNVGLIKAPFMGLIIGVVAATEGLKVSGSAESLGRQTTASVVKAIFMVIVVDGLFAIFFAAIGY